MMNMELDKKRIEEFVRRTLKDYKESNCIGDFVFKSEINENQTDGTFTKIGVRPLVKLSQATSAEEFFKLKVADELKRGLKEFETEELKSREFGLNYTIEMIRKLKEYGCPGVHLFTLNDLGLIKDLLGKI